MIKYLSLFSGIGAFESALKKAGIDYELLGFSEIDKFAIKSYCEIHCVENNLNLGDISKIDISILPTDIDLITHGSPCQDFSVAGKGKGGDKGSGTRSSLMWNTVEIVKQCRPKVIIWENVKNLLSKKHKHNFDSYLEVMSNIGYNNYYKVLNAKDFGIPQNRERVFTISIRKDIDKGFEFPKPIELKLRLKDLLETKVDEKFYLKDEIVNRFVFKDSTMAVGNTQPKILEYPCIATNIGNTNAITSVQKDNYVLVKEATKTGYKKAYKGDSINLEQPNSKTRRGRVGKQIANTLTTSCNIGVVDGFRIRKLTPLECWRLMGFSDGYFGKAAKVCSNSQLYKQAGNSIVVDVLVNIFNNLEYLFK